MLYPILNRCVVKISGHIPDIYAFLQGLITNDIYQLDQKGALYSLMLTPQGRFLYDFFITKHFDGIYLEIEEHRCQDFVRILTQYRLRAQITFSVNLNVRLLATFDTPPFEFQSYSYPDPRTSQLGHRLIVDQNMVIPNLQNFAEYDVHRIKHAVPDGSRDMIVQKSIPLEYCMEKWNALSWTKGCYLGQELTARTKHVGQVRKSIYTLRYHGIPPAQGEKIYLQDQHVGFALSHAQGLMLCHLRMDAWVLSQKEALFFTSGSKKLEPLPSV